MSPKRVPATVRQNEILAEVAKTGHASVGEIAERLGVSEMTVRRDMDKMGDKGQLVRTHGGAQMNDDLRSKIVELIEPSVENRAARNRAEKMQIAAEAIQRIPAKSTIAIDVGTTCYELANLLSDTSIRVISNSLPIQALLAKNQMQVFAPCGRITGADPSTVGAQAVGFIKKFNFEVAFLAVAGITKDGLYDYSIEDAEIKKTLAAQSQTRILLLDSSKIGKISAVKVMNFEHVDIMITDAPIPRDFEAMLHDHDVQVIVTG